jgi:predicted glycosyltransferase
MSAPGGGRAAILIHCQYVYGIGHFVRSVELARALSRSFDVVLLNGGEPVPNYVLPPAVRCVQLPAIYKREQLDALIPVDPSMSLDACLAARRALIEAVVGELAPAIVITEHFPFGLLFEAEAMAMIAHARRVKPRARIVCSVRDVIESARGGRRDAHICEILNAEYDMVLVHGDPRIVPFTASFPMAAEIRIPLAHTGYIVRAPAPRAPASGAPILLASVGGGRMGEELLDAAIDAHAIAARRWPHRLVVFAGAFQADVQRLRARACDDAPAQVRIHAFDDAHYRATLSMAAGLVCMGGYNTLLEAVASGLPALVYQRHFHGDNHEQALRVQLFDACGLIRAMGPEDLPPERMAARLLAFAATGARADTVVGIDGAERARQLLERLL